MKVIGLIGGIACGKTSVAKILRDQGAAIISADPIVHEVLEVPEIKDQMWMRWRNRGYSVHYQGEGHRGVIADIVFNDREELRFLEDITEPLVTERILSKLALYHPRWTPAVVLDVPLLLEMGMDTHCHMIWYIDMPKDLRLSNFKMRYVNRLNPKGVPYTAEELEANFEARERRQWGEDDKKARATSVIVNHFGNMGETERVLKTLWRREVCQQ